ncbi:MAG TPA: efflux RND transporter periplasmic adaptor subunit [Thioalkalivibrio sp.]|nr:efflux RND transporter periplasmic adaptor subunit [Thioalkalivibrio sp.]
MKKIVIAAVILIVAAGAWYFQAKSSKPAGAKRGGPVPVVVAPVVRDTFATTVQAVGTARANESVDITAKVTETVDSLNFEDGQQVQTGDLLVQLSSDRQRAELEIARVNLAEQEREYKRLSGLVQQRAIPQSQLDTQLSRLESARAQLAAAQTSVADRRILAPFDGVLGLRRVSPGSLVSPGTVLVTLDDTDPIKLDFTVSEVFFPALMPGLEIVARSAAYRDAPVAGQVVSVDSRVDPVTRAIAVRAHLPNPEGRLRPGMLMTVRLQTDEREALVIPESALVPLEDRQYVFLIDEANTARRVEVEIGRRRPGEVEILDGLSEGDRVVTEGTIRLRPGAEVRVMREAGATG